MLRFTPDSAMAQAVKEEDEIERASGRGQPLVDAVPEHLATGRDEYFLPETNKYILYIK